MKRPKTAAGRHERVAEILRRLDAMYPGATCALHHGNPWELLVATILSAQCTDKRVNEVTPGLFAKYPTPLDFAAVRPEVLANDIRSTGFFNNKAKSIVGAAKRVVSEFGGQVPKTMDEMLTIPGAARKTANVVLGTAYGIASGVVVDTHVQRLSARLDLTKHSD
ncbi:MAG TPA: endonuclease III, partial [Candidatus Sulfopaludibacter sp.]|nr:endonuclease III [Candidatus Sulfopaludibacter sp.]